MTTKAFLRFKNRVDHYTADIEAVDLLRRSTEAVVQSIFASVSHAHHPTLARRARAEKSYRSTIEHLRKTVVAAYIKDLYEDLTHYIRDIMKATALVNPERFVGDHNIKVNAKDLLGLGSWEAVVQRVSDSIYQSMESERSTRKLVKKLSKKLGLNLDEGVVSNALPYLEARHLLVHEDGRVSDDFASDFSAFGHQRGGRLKLNAQFANDAREAITMLASEIDAEVVRMDLCEPSFLQPSAAQSRPATD